MQSPTSYIDETRILGYADTAEDMLRFGDMFDMDHFNRVARESGRVEMVKTEEFERHSPSLSMCSGKQKKRLCCGSLNRTSSASVIKTWTTCWWVASERWTKRRGSF